MALHGTSSGGGGATSVSGTGATVTADAPVVNVTQTWNNAAVAFTGIKENVTDTASDAASKLLDLQVAGTSRFSVNKDGSFRSEPTFGSSFSYLNGSLLINNTQRFDAVTGNFTNFGGGSIGWASGTVGLGTPTIDTPMTQVAAGIVKIAHGSATTGGALVTDPCTVATLPAAAAAGVGARAFVTDANATTFNSTVAAGGANKVPVFSDGTNWKIG